MKKALALLSTFVIAFFCTNIIFAKALCDYEWTHTLANIITRKLYYVSNTQYSSQWNHAVSVWNAQNRISIQSKPLIGSTVDVTVSDYTETSSVLGVTNIPYKTIKFNVYNFKNMTDTERKKTALHELGHALKLSHTDDQSVVVVTVMRSGKISLDALGTLDKNIYKCIWP